MNRPEAWRIAGVALDAEGKPMPNALKRAKSRLRCPSEKRHLMAFVLHTEYGSWVAWRTPPGSGVAQYRWHNFAWLDEADRARVWCACPKNWSVGFRWLAEQTGDVLAGPDVPRASYRTDDDSAVL